MSEAILNALTGGETPNEQDTRTAIAAEDAASADSVAMSVAMDAARFDPELSRKAADYLERQGRLVDHQARLVALQAHHFEADRAMALDAAQRKRFADRLRNTVQFLVTLVAVAIALGLMVMVHDAAVSQRVVVAAFAAPPSLAASGISGEVAAAGLVDELQKLQNATRATERGLQTAGAWAGDIRIELPETGVSIGELDRLLHARLGHDLHIGGDLVLTNTGGLSLTVRGDGVPAQHFDGPASSLADLTRAAAEYVYGQAQPSRFAAYLVGAGRDAEAIAFLPGALRRAPDDALRAKLANSWGNALADENKLPEARAKYRLAMALRPDNWLAWSNLIEAFDTEEAQVHEANVFLRAASAAPASRRPELRLFGAAAGVKQDLPLLLAATLDDAHYNSGAGANDRIIEPQIADAYGLMHDPQNAARVLALADPDDAVTKAETLLLQGYQAAESNDWAAALPPMERFWRAWLADPGLQATYVDAPCLTGLAYGLTGKLAEAEAVFKRIGAWSRCAAYHGAVLDHAGDAASAMRVWAEGLAACEDCSLVYLERGRAEARRGAYAAALADLAAAHDRSPHFADPLKAWGDVLAAEGQWRAALAKYAEARADAPNWQTLRVAEAKLRQMHDLP